MCRISPISPNTVTPVCISSDNKFSKKVTAMIAVLIDNSIKVCDMRQPVFSQSNCVLQAKKNGYPESLEIFPAVLHAYCTPLREKNNFHGAVDLQVTRLEALLLRRKSCYGFIGSIAMSVAY